MTHGLSDPRTLNEMEAFDAMCAFLAAYWERGGRASDDLAVLLGSLSRSISVNGMPADAALWTDWLDAVGSLSTADHAGPRS